MGTSIFVSDHPNARDLQRLYGAEGFEAALELMKEMIAEPFVLHSGGDSPVAGDFAGLAGMTAHLTHLAELSGGTFGLTQLGFYADDHWGLVPQIASASRAGRSLEMSVAGYWRFAGPGRLAEHWEVASDPRVWHDFWA